MGYRDQSPALKAEYERIGRERERASRETDRLYRWELIRVCAELLGCSLLGVLVAACGFAVTDYQTGKALLYGGMVINYGGIAVSLWLAHQRGEARGDW
jgi:hypothetical protein